MYSNMENNDVEQITFESTMEEGEIVENPFVIHNDDAADINTNNHIDDNNNNDNNDDTRRLLGNDYDDGTTNTNTAGAATIGNSSLLERIQQQKKQQISNNINNNNSNNSNNHRHHYDDNDHDNDHDNDIQHHNDDNEQLFGYPMVQEGSYSTTTTTNINNNTNNLYIPQYSQVPAPSPYNTNHTSSSSSSSSFMNILSVVGNTAGIAAQSAYQGTKYLYSKITSTSTNNNNDNNIIMNERGSSGGMTEMDYQRESLLFDPHELEDHGSSIAAGGGYISNTNTNARSTTTNMPSGMRAGIITYDNHPHNNNHHLLGNGQKIIICIKQVLMDMKDLYFASSPRVQFGIVALIVLIIYLIFFE